MVLIYIIGASIIHYKKTLLKGFYLTTIITCLFINLLNAQLVFEINEPANLIGIYPSIAPQNGWGSPNLSTNGNWFSDTLVVANDGVLGSACSALITPVVGQFGLFYRNQCSIDDQLLNVQNSGATGAIIIDTITGRPLPFNSLAQSSLINIPFVIISKDEGDSLMNAIANGETAVVSFGDKTSINNFDLGIYMETSIWSSYGYYPLRNSSYFTDTLLGAWIYNHGNSTVSDAQLKFYLKGMTSAIDYEIISGPQTINPGDSIYVPISFPEIIDFNAENYGLKYGYDLLSAIIDSDTLDNRISNFLFTKKDVSIFGNDLGGIISPSFYNDTTGLNYLDYFLTADLATWNHLGYRVIKFIPGCICEIVLSKYPNDFTNNTIVSVYNLANWDGTNFFSGSTFLLDSGYDSFMTSSRNHYSTFRYDIVSDTIGIVFEAELKNVGFTSDMYHDEKRRQSMTNNILFYEDMVIKELDKRLTPCTYAIMPNNLGTCYGIGISEIKEESFRIYPNPSNGKINILSNTFINPHSIYVLNIYGEIVLKLPYADEVKLTLPSGIYFLKISDLNNNSHVEKIIIESF